jgi:hypothetical protein
MKRCGAGLSIVAAGVGVDGDRGGHRERISSLLLIILIERGFRDLGNFGRIYAGHLFQSIASS